MVFCGNRLLVKHTGKERVEHGTQFQASAFICSKLISANGVWYSDIKKVQVTSQYSKSKIVIYIVISLDFKYNNLLYSNLMKEKEKGKTKYPVNYNACETSYTTLLKQIFWRSMKFCRTRNTCIYCFSFMCNYEALILVFSYMQLFLGHQKFKSYL